MTDKQQRGPRGAASVVFIAIVLAALITTQGGKQHGTISGWVSKHVNDLMNNDIK